MTTLVEVCVDDPAGAADADRAGADRVELCSALLVGGLTPSIGTVTITLEAVRHTGVQVLIRPRHGDFVFDTTEMRTMIADIDAVLRVASGSPVTVGFVIGALTPASEIDAYATAELVAACQGAPVTFHRAFDLTPDLDASLDALADLGVNRVLTGGGVARAMDGLSTLAHLVERAAERITILAAGSVRPNNAARIVRETGVGEVHFRATRTVPNHLSPRHPAVRMSVDRAPVEESREQTSAEVVTEMLMALRPAG